MRKLIVKDYGVAVSDNNRGIYIEPLSNHAFESRNEPALSKPSSKICLDDLLSTSEN